MSASANGLGFRFKVYLVKGFGKLGAASGTFIIRIIVYGMSP